MNALEIANLLEVDSWYKLVTREEIATMLRQQQAEIEALKNRNWELVSEPWGFDRHEPKTLTDEEITEVIKKIASNNEYVYSLYEDFEGIEFSRVGIFEFSRAILRKAQEKC